MIKKVFSMRFIWGLILLSFAWSGQAQGFGDSFGAGDFNNAAFAEEAPLTSSIYNTVDEVELGQSFVALVEFDIKEHWHVFWKKSGGLSLPVKFNSDNLPEWLKVEGITYPFPVYHYDDILESAAYYNEGKSFYKVRFRVLETAPLGDHKINFGANWQACDPTSCVDGKEELLFDLKVGAKTALKADAEAKLQEAAKVLPQVADESWRVHGQEVSENGSFVRVTIQAPAGELLSLGKIQFFPSDDQLHAQEKHRSWSINGSVASRLFEYNKEEGVALESFSGVFRFAQNGVAQAVALEGKIGNEAFVPVAETKSDALPYRSVGGEVAEKSTGLFKNLILAFFGGLILNLMPCVFPVLSLKVMGFVKQSQEGKGSAFSHALAFTAGVVISFWILAGTILALRASGGTINWGDQLQNPYVSTIVIAILFALALNLFGLFEVGVSLTAAGGTVKKSGFSGSFMSGVLATVVATPCMAPMLGAALTYAFTQPATVAMIVFTFIALGLSSPYLIFALFPAALKLMPKPGAWMETFKKSMGFLMLLAVVWLLESLEGIIGMERLVGVLFAFVGLAVALWFYGMFSPVYVEKSKRFKGLAFAALLFAGSVWYANHSINYQDKLEWKKFSPLELEKALAEGKPVFVDFTAKWCATCQVNKKLAVYPNASLFEEKGVVLMRADKTKPNPEINRILEYYGNVGVPMNLLYDGENPQPIKFPETFTQGLLEEELKKLD